MHNTYIWHKWAECMDRKPNPFSRLWLSSWINLNCWAGAQSECCCSQKFLLSPLCVWELLVLRLSIHPYAQSLVNLLSSLLSASTKNATEMIIIAIMKWVRSGREKKENEYLRSAQSTRGKIKIYGTACSTDFFAICFLLVSERFLHHSF